MKTTDFFGRQENARRNTWILVILFLLAVLVMIAAIYLAAIIAFALAKPKTMQQFAWFQPGMMLIVASATLTVIGLGSLYKTLEMRRGGEQVAVMLGGRLVNPATPDHAERRLLNVVEEMALASGVAVPPLYLLEHEPGINAFAAGFTPDDAVIGVSRGAIDFLNRDQLQGVVAHEFSHILNGDMRFNLRLIGVLHGILVVGLIGYYVLRMGGGSGRSSGRGKGSLHFVLIGLAVTIAGYVGLFFGRLIKAAISRQREYLADASAVQFTRNPDAVSGALKMIGGLTAQSYVVSPAAETASHMFFGSAIHYWAHSPFRTHPPLVARIRAIEPQFDGSFPHIAPIDRRQTPTLQKPTTGPPSRKFSATATSNLATSSVETPNLEKLFPGVGFSDTIPLDPAVVLAAVGAPTMQHVDYASSLLASLPATVEQSAREPFGARCIVFALLLDPDLATRQRQLQSLTDREDAATARETERLAEQIAELSKSARLPLIEIAQGALRRLSPEQYQQFRHRVIELIKADEKVNLFEFIVQCVLLHHLDRVFELARPARVQYYSIRGVISEVATLLSAIAHVGHRGAAVAEQHYSASIVPLQLDRQQAVFLARGQCTLSRLKTAIEKLATCSMPIKKRILGAATLCVAADGTVTVGEAELLRAVADSLDCPIPPILPGKLKQAG